ncbi:enhanced intracellular survival protein Eis, partial [Chloroflexota bacterium]
MSEMTMRVLTDTQEREESILQLGGYAFESSPPLPTDWQDWFKNMGDATVIALLDGDKSIAQVCSGSMTQNVRGKIYDVGGVWGVATHPGYRRQGYVRDLMAELLKVGYEQGEAFSTLYPFRASFYGRMGYVTFPQLRNFQFNPRDLSSVSKMPLRGHVELMLLSEGWDIYRAFM